MALAPTTTAEVAAAAQPAKFKFVAEYPINASAKLLFPYVSTAGGLAQWFCDDVKLTPGHMFNFVWDGEPHYAAVAGQRLNRFIKFVFTAAPGREPAADAAYLEFALEVSELTQQPYLRVTDYSTESDRETLHELWDGLVQTLRDIVGG